MTEFGGRRVRRQVGPVAVLQWGRGVMGAGWRVGWQSWLSFEEREERGGRRKRKLDLGLK